MPAREITLPCKYKYAVFVVQITPRTDRLAFFFYRCRELRGSRVGGDLLLNGLRFMLRHTADRCLDTSGL